MIKGRKIKAVRALTQKEMANLGWDRVRVLPVGIVLDDGTVLVASRDEEGNGPGAMFGFGKQGDFLLAVTR